VEDTILASPSIASRDFGFYGDQNGWSPRQLRAARRFAGFFDYLMYILEDAIEDRELRENNPATWLDYKMTYEQAKRFVQSGLVAMKVQGSKERGAMPLVVQSDVDRDIYRNLTGSSSRADELEEAKHRHREIEESQTKAELGAQLAGTRGALTGEAPPIEEET